MNASYGGDAQTGMPQQVLMVFLVELSSEADARALLEVAGRKKPSDDALLALAEGRLFCLLVARSVLAGAKNEETNEGVRRFSGGLTEILRRHSKG